MKQCPKCGETKGNSEFYARPDGRLHSWCIVCTKALRVSRKSTDALMAKIKRKYFKNRMTDAVHRKDYQLQYKYGIGIDEYKAMLKQQNHRCAICECTRSAGRDLAVDHDHDTSIVRGLLCGDCNIAISLLQDNPHLLRKAAAYLDLHANLIGQASLEAEIVSESISLDSPNSIEIDSTIK